MQPANITLSHSEGVASRAGDAASGDQVIAHGLGVIPDKIKIYATSVVNGTREAIGTYDGTTINGIYTMGWTGYTVAGTSNTYLLQIYTSAGIYQRATVTFDATNITLSWVKTGSTVATVINLLWEAQVNIT